MKETPERSMPRDILISRLTVVFFAAALLPCVASVLFWHTLAVAPVDDGLLAGWPALVYGLLASAIFTVIVRPVLVAGMSDGGGRHGERRRLGTLRRLTHWSAAILTIHVIAGHLLAAYSIGVESVPWSVWSSLAIPLALAALFVLPLWTYGYGLLGLRFGERLAARPAVTLESRLLVLALLLPLLAVSVVPLFLLARGGAIDAPLAVLWALVTGYVCGVFLMAFRNQRRSLAPLRELLKRPAGEPLDDIAAASLDEVGLCVNHMRKLQQHAASVERELVASEQRTRMFAEAASDFLYEIDENLRLSFVSDRFEELTGIPTSLIIGQSAVDLGRSYIASDRRAHQEDLLAHRPYWRYRYSLKTRDGGLRHLQIRGLPYYDDQGRFKGYRGAGSDITEFVETQQRLVEKEAELGQAQRMEALSQLTGGVAHDFNNFLTAHMGHLELALESSDIPESARHHIQTALDGARAGEALAHRLLAFSRRQSLRPAPVDVGELMEDLGSRVTALLGERIRFSMEPVEGDIAAMVDAAALRQCVLNLVMNARDAMPEGGTLYASAALTLLSAGDPSGLPPGDYVSLTLADTGSGIDPHHLKHVFEPYFTTKAPGEGIGLGLSMVYGFAAQSGGGVRVESPLGGGTQVELLLPACRSAGASMTLPGYMPGATGSHLLVVEDDPALCAVICRMLRDQGYEVAGVGSAPGALDFLAAHADVDLVVCDVVLPGDLSGLDVLRQARQRGHGAQWLLMSGYALADGQFDEANLAGCEILRKPFRSRELAERVAELLGAHNLLQRRVG
jgi:PAS domain S-box-containing protein